MERFDRDCQDPALKQIIREDQALGRQVKVQGVPAVFINGKKIKFNSSEEFFTAIEAALIGPGEATGTGAAEEPEITGKPGVTTIGNNRPEIEH